MLGVSRSEPAFGGAVRLDQRRAHRRYQRGRRQTACCMGTFFGPDGGSLPRRGIRDRIERKNRTARTARTALRCMLHAACCMLQFAIAWRLNAAATPQSGW